MALTQESRNDVILLPSCLIHSKHTVEFKVQEVIHRPLFFKKLLIVSVVDIREDSFEEAPAFILIFRFLISHFLRLRSTFKKLIDYF